MRIHCGYDIAYSLPAPTPMIFLLDVHPTREGDLYGHSPFVTDPVVPVDRFLDAYGNRATRLVAPAGSFRVTRDFIVHDSGRLDTVDPTAPETPVAALPPETLLYLLGSRYVDTDLLGDVAWSRFGAVAPGWPRLQAIIDFAHGAIRFDYQLARSTRTASEALREGVGVCRDYAHLVIALCRCLNMPARYCTGYLGDIGVPRDPAPMDFSAWVEVFLGGRWYTVDARHHRPRIGRIVMARGRDAADVAISTAFGPAPLQHFIVVTDEVAAEGVASTA